MLFFAGDGRLIPPYHLCVGVRNLIHKGIIWRAFIWHSSDASTHALKRRNAPIRHTSLIHIPYTYPYA